MVINVGMVKAGLWQNILDEINEVKEGCKGKLLQVIIETCLLTDEEKIEMCKVVTESGADFIKTSTGKIGIGATPEAFYVMCNAIKDYYNETGTKIGIKAAGGIRTANDAAKYYTIASEILGEDWMNKDLVRIGAASLANNLIAAINE